MVAQYLKIAFRNMRKHKTQSLTGIFGLAFGLACFVPALYWLRYETTYDSFYPDSEHIYRIYSVDKQTGKVNDLVSGILEKKLHERFAAMETSTVFFIDQNDCRSEGMPHIRLRTLFTDNTFFSVFPQTVISGNAQHALQITNNIVLTESVAVRLFGNAESAIGQQIKSTTLLSLDPPYTVTAVVKDPPPSTNLPFDAILSHEQVKLQKSLTEKSGNEIWTYSFLQMYVRFPSRADIAGLAEQLRNFPLQSYGNANIELRMLPVSDVRHQLNASVPFTMNFIHLFVVAGILLLLSALFNFLNLYRDLFRQRSREFRLRAIHGALDGQLIRQMTFELTCAIFLALLFAGCFVIIAGPAFSGLLDITLDMSRLIRLFVVCGISVMALMLFVALILFWRLSRLATRPRSERKIHEQPALRRLAVTLQLAVSVVFIVAALVVMVQMRFVNHKDLGFDRTGVVHLTGLHPFINDAVRVALVNELSFIPQVESVTDASFELQHSVNPFKMTTDVEWPGKSAFDKPAFHFIDTDSRFAETFRINMLMGEWLDEAGGNKVVLNEEAVRVMRLSEPIGATIRMTLNDTQEYKVVGVVKDFHTLSIRNRIQPTIFMTAVYPANSLYVRVEPGREQEAMQRITTVLPTIDATFADVDPVPLDDLYNRLNYSEQAGLKIFSVLATVCLLISLFGIYAVATAATQRRRKEIAIRKVAGADAGDIVRMFFREYTLLVVIACAVALPPVYFAMSRWLQGYAYHTDISWWLLAGVVTGVVAVVLLTVLGQVLKAANNNPAEVVKSE